jgi:hypothetical protein
MNKINFCFLLLFFLFSFIFFCFEIGFYILISVCAKQDLWDDVDACECNSVKNRNFDAQSRNF